MAVPDLYGGGCKAREPSRFDDRFKERDFKAETTRASVNIGEKLGN